MRNPSSQAGFSLIELLVAILIAIQILIAAAMAFDLNNRVALTQTQITDLQQSLRVAQYDMTRLSRMAGRGNLPLRFRPDLAWAGPGDIQGLAVEVRNNVDNTPDRHIARGDIDAPEAVLGTDVLIVRGCLTAGVYQVVDGTFQYDLADPTNRATVPIQNVSEQGIRQPLAPLCQELVPGSLVILNSAEGRDTYGVAAIEATDCPPDPSVEPSTVNLTLDISLNSPLQWLNPAGGALEFPANMNATLVCALEEYRYYVREEFEDPADPTSPLRSRLARARFEPGTETPYRADDQNLRLDLADNVFDLQVALGLDSNFPSAVGTPGAFGDDADALNNNDDEVIFEADLAGNARASDDWLYNHEEDDPTALRYRQRDFPGRVGDPVDLRQIRITTLARTARPDPGFRAPDFDPHAGRDMVEDHDYFPPAPASLFNSTENRRFRRRALTTIVDPRNL